VYYGRRGGSSYIGGQAWSMAVMVFMMGLVVGRADNYGHAGGFIGGYLAGRLLDPLKQEQINHMLIAVVCLVLSVLSVVASVVHSLYWLR
jgi:rhomboid protease GluP